MHTIDIRAWGLARSKSVFVVDQPCTEYGKVRGIVMSLLWKCASVGLIVVNAKLGNRNTTNVTSLLSTKSPYPFAILANQAETLPHRFSPSYESLSIKELLKVFKELDKPLTTKEVFDSLNRSRSKARIYPTKMWFCSAVTVKKLSKGCASSIDADPFMDMNDYNVMLEQDRILLPRGILALTMELLKESLSLEERNERDGENGITLPFQDATIRRRYTTVQYIRRMNEERLYLQKIVEREKIVEYLNAKIERENQKIQFY